MRSYKISLEEKSNRYSEKVKNILVDCLQNMIDGKSNISNLQSLIKKYPEVIEFYYYLIISYSQIGQFEKAELFAKKLQKEFPDDIYGVFLLCEIYIYIENIEEIDKIIGGSNDISEVFPDRDEFGINDVINYHVFLIKYYLTKNKNIEARKQKVIILNLCKEFDYEYDFTTVNGLFGILEDDEFLSLNEKIVNVKEREYNTKNQTKEKPIFKHKEIEALYQHNEFIDKKIIEDILKLPKDTLIEDLETVLEDAIKRYEYFSYKYHNENYELIFFPLHSLLLLAELKSKKLLPKIFDFFKQESLFFLFYFEYTQFYISKILLHLLDKDNYKLFVEFFKEENIGCIQKAFVFEALLVSKFNNILPKAEYEKTINDLLDFIISSKNNPNIYDNELNSLLVTCIVENKATEFLDKIKILYKKDMVVTELCSEYEEVLLELEDDEEIVFLKFENIFKAYLDITESLSISYNLDDYDGGDDDDDFYESYIYDDYDFSDDYETVKTPIINDHKNIGRNDPCPCGSGKKYKKCCWGK